MKVRRYALGTLSLGFALSVSGCRSAITAPDGAPPLPEFRVVGNERISRSALLSEIEGELASLAQDGIDRSDVDDLAYGLELAYRSLGFPETYVEYEFDPGAGKRGRATFLVQEGPRVQVAAFQIQGNQADGFSTEEVEPLFFARAGALFGGRRWFVRDELESGRRELEGRYLAEGYLRVEIDELDVTFEDRADARVALVGVRVHEGPRFVLREARIESTDPDVTLNAEALDAIRELRFDDEGRPLPYTPRLVQAIRAQLVEQLGADGYAEAKVEVRIDLDEGTGDVELVYRATPGPRITVAEVTFRGNEKTRSAFLRNRVTIEPGTVYDVSAVRDSFRRLFATHLFQRVELDLERIEGSTDPTERRLVVEVTELPSREVYAEPGYGSYEGPRVKLGAVEKNVLGSGRSIRGETTLSGKYQRFILSLTDRALFRSDVSGTASAFFAHRVEPSFTFEELGSALDFGHEWPRSDIEAVLGYRYRSTEVVDVEVQSAELGEFLNHIDISSITLTVSHDTRDHLFVPSRGSRTRMQVEWANGSLGSEVEFLASSVQHSRFYGMPWDGGVFGFGIDTGLIAPTGDQDVLPLQVRLFNGGATTVRSFEQDELGPKDSNGEPLGGEAYSVVSAELRQSLLGNLSGAVFYDAGNLAPQYEDYLEFNGMRQAIGVGLRYLLPLGPARIDVGVNPDPGMMEDDWVAHFALGLSF